MCPSVTDRRSLRSHISGPSGAAKTAHERRCRRELLSLLGNRARASCNAFTFWPQDSRTGSSWQLSVMLQDHDACINVDVYGVEGVPLFHEQRCEPDACVRYSRWGQSTCGNPPSSGVDATRIDDRTCSNPPVLGFEVGTGVVYPKATPTPTPNAGHDTSAFVTPA
jgi:hypothetical protein